MQLNDVTWSTVIVAAGLFVLLLGIYTTVMGAIKTARSEIERKNRPLEDIRTRLDDHDTRLGNCEQQLGRLHSQNEDQDKVTKLILRANLALIRHGVDGNNISGLRDMRDEIQDFLIEK